MINIDERIADILSESVDGDTRISYPDGTSKVVASRALLGEDVKQLIRDVLAEVKPEHMTEEKYSDEWNYMDGWNGYEATMESKVKELGL